MKKILFILITAIVLTSCGNNHSPENDADTANSLPDTMPGPGYTNDTVALDSNPADKTRVDSLNY